MKQISGRDASFLFLDDGTGSSTPFSCYVIRRDDGRTFGMSTEEVVNWLDERVEISDLFRSKIVRLPGDVGLPYWFHDPNFSVGDHVVVHDPEGLDWTTAQQQLAAMAAVPLDAAKPLWRIDVIPDIHGFPGHPGLSTLVAFNFNHVLFDGATFAELTAQMFDDHPSFTPAHSVGAESASVARLTLREVLRIPVVWVGGAYRTIRALLTIRKNRLASTVPPPPKHTWTPTRFNRRYVGPRIPAFLKLDRPTVSTMKQRIPGATTNDVMLAIVGEALRAYLSEIGEPVCESLGALIPVSTRTTDAASSNSNEFGYMSIDLMVTEPDLRTRIASIAEQTAAEKAVIRAEASATTGPVIDMLPAPVLRGLCGLNMRAKKKDPTKTTFHVVISSVYTGSDSMTIFGLPMVESFGIQPLTTGTTLGLALTHRASTVNVSVTADQSVMPDISRFCALLEQSYRTHAAELIDEAGRGNSDVRSRA